MTETRKEPDWEGFGRELMEHWPTREVDGSDLFEAAARNGLLVEIPGGYDPENHIDAEGICPEPGDPWYEYAFGRDREARATPAVQEARNVALQQAADLVRDWQAYTLYGKERISEEMAQEILSLRDTEGGE